MSAEKIHPPSESSSAFIRFILKREGKDYVYHLWKLWAARIESLGMKAPQYVSFRVYVRTVERAGLVRRTTPPKDVREYRGNLKPFQRVYLELVPGRIRDEKAWANPQVAVYGEKVRLGKRRYRRRVLGLPPKTKVGRPPKKREP